MFRGKVQTDLRQKLPEPLAHLFCGSGAEYAEGHIVPLAQAQEIMAPEAGGVHNPGLAHEGFAVCDPSGG